MKILTLSAYYPPFSYGGYENRVRDVMDGLAARGHQVNVLTTQPDKTMQTEEIEFPYPVIRRLHGTRKMLGWAERLTSKESTNRLGVVLIFMRQIWRDIHDLRLFDHTIQGFKPVLIYLGNILPLSPSLMPFLSRILHPLVVDDGGKTLCLSYENRGLWYRFQTEFLPTSIVLQLIKKAFTSLVSVLSSDRLTRDWVWPDRIKVFFNSYSNYRYFFAKTIPIDSSRVIHSGLDLRKFSFERKKNPLEPLSIIVPGRIESSKGQLDAVKLSTLLRQAGVQHNLTIVGDRWRTDYASQIEEQVRQLGLEKYISFLPMQEKCNLIELYHQSDICFFPSYQQTGFSRIPLEAMACGCVLLSYGNEGSDEIIMNGVNGFLFSPGAIEQVKETVMALENNKNLLSQVAYSARKTVEEHHSIPVYLDQIEAFLNGKN